MYRVVRDDGLVVHPRLGLLAATELAKRVAEQKRCVMLAVSNDTNRAAKVVAHRELAGRARAVFQRVQWHPPSPKREAIKRDGCKHDWMVVAGHEQTILRCQRCEAWGYTRTGATVGSSVDNLRRTFAYQCRAGNGCKAPARHRMRPRTWSGAARWEHWCDVHVPAAEEVALP